MSLVSVAEVKALVKTSLGEEDLQRVIDRVEAEITSRIGVPQNDAGTVTVTLTLEGEVPILFLPTEISSVTSVVEDDLTLESDYYRTWSGGQLERLPEGVNWGEECVVTYKPADDRSLRTQVVIELIRIDLDRTALRSESVANEYSYQAPDWELERRKQFKRLRFQSL